MQHVNDVVAGDDGRDVAGRRGWLPQRVVFEDGPRGRHTVGVSRSSADGGVQHAWLMLRQRVGGAWRT